jgi:hypothetical protein
LSLLGFPKNIVAVLFTLAENGLRFRLMATFGDECRESWCHPLYANTLHPRSSHTCWQSA